MNAFLELLRREWREARALVLAGFVIGPLLLGLVQSLFVPDVADDLLATIVLAAAVLLLALLAADATAREAEDGSGELLARLPLAARLAWLARALFLASTGAAFVLWLVACESWRRRLAGGDPLALELEGWSLYLPLGIAAVAAAACLAGLTRRAFASALAGIGVVLAPLLLPVPERFVPYLGHALSIVRPDWMAAWLAATCVLASLSSYSPRAGALARTRRRALLALLALAGLGTPGLAWTIWRASTPPIDVVPGRAFIFGGMHLSPDGRYLALVAAVRRGRSGRDLHCESWILDREELDLVQVEGWRSHRPFVRSGIGSSSSPWGSDGRLRVLVDGHPFQPDALPSFGVVDPHSGRTELTQAELDRVEREMGAPRWGRRHPDPGGRESIEIVADGSRHELPGRLLALSPVETAVFLERDPGVVERYELVTGSACTLLQLAAPIWRADVSPDGERLVVTPRLMVDGRPSGVDPMLSVIDARSGRLVHRGPLAHCQWTSSDGHGLFVRSPDAPPRLIVDGGERELPPRLRYALELPDGGLLCLTYDGRVVEVDADGTERRVLWGRLFE